MVKKAWKYLLWPFAVPNHTFKYLQARMPSQVFGLFSTQDPDFPAAADFVKPGSSLII